MIKKNKVSVTKISVQWGEMDAFNHVNNVMYIRWCETARISLFRDCLLYTSDAADEV